MVFIHLNGKYCSGFLKQNRCVYANQHNCTQQSIHLLYKKKHRSWTIMKHSGLNPTKKFQQIAPIQSFLINEPSPGQSTNTWSPSLNSSKRLLSQHVRLSNNGAGTNRWSEEEGGKIKTQGGPNAGRAHEPDAWLFDRDWKERKGELENWNRA